MKQKILCFNFHGRLLASFGVCWHVMFPGDALGVSGGCLGGVWGHLSGVNGNQRRPDVFGVYLGLRPCNMEPKH